MKTLNRFTALLTLGLFAPLVSVQATPRTWSGAGADGTWTNAANWAGGIAPAVFNDNLIFAGSLRLNNTNNYAAITNTGITFSNAGFTVYGNQVTLNGNITNRIGTNSINADLSLAALPIINMQAGQLNLNGVISGGFGLTVNGGGNVQLGRANSYNGVTTITPTANLIITNANALGFGNVNQGGKAGGTLGGALILAFPPNSNNTITNAFNGFAASTAGDAAAPNLLNLSGTNTIRADRFVSAGGGNGDIVQSDGGLLILAGDLYGTTAGRIVALTGSGDGWVTGSIRNNGGNLFFPRKYGTGKWTLFGTNTYSLGDLEIYTGTLALGATARLDTPNRGVNMVRSGTIFDVSALSSGWLMTNGQFLTGFGSVIGTVDTVTNAIGTTPTTRITPGTGLGQSVMPISGNLRLNGNTILQYNLSPDPTGLVIPSDKIVVAGNLTAQNSNNVALGAYIGYLNNGIYPLIQYGGTFTGDVTNFTVTGFTSIARGVQGGYITNLANAISLVVTGTPAANLTWKGYVNGNWDTNTFNWTNAAAAAADKFYNFDAVNFDDSATSFTVSVITNVTSGGLNVNASSNYSISAAGGVIGGNGGLTKLGSGKLTLSGANTWTGPNTFGGGTVSVASIGSGAAAPLGNANNSIGGNQFFNGGTLEYTGLGETCTRFFAIGTNGGTLAVTNATATLVMGSSGAFVSAGAAYPALTKTGPGALSFLFQNQLLGTNRILGGILSLNGANPAGIVFGSDVTSPVIINGGALDITGLSLGAKPVIVAGMGDLVTSGGLTNGAIINTGTGQNNALRFVTMTGDTAFGGTGRWDIRGNPTASLSTGGNAYNLVKAGGNQVSLFDVTVDPALGDIDIQGGTLSYEGGTTGLGGAAKTLTVQSLGTFNMFAATTPLNKQVVIKDGGTVSVTSGANTITGPVNMPGDTLGGGSFNLTAGTSLTLSGVVSGAGSLTLGGGGTLTLAATNSYSGATVVNAGKLTVNSRSTGTGAISVADGAAFRVNVAGTGQLPPASLTLGSSLGPVTNEFDGVFSTTVAPVATTDLFLNGTTTVSILSGTLISGGTYPLISYSTINGSGGFVLGSLPPLVVASIVTNGNTIALSVSFSPTFKVWKGIVNNQWDIGTTTNWTFSGSPATFLNGNPVEFDDTASTNNVNIVATVQPGGVYLNNNTLNYTLSGSAIGGTGSLNKLGSGTATLSSANTFSGGTVVANGTLAVNNNSALGTGTVTLTGGALDNTSPSPVTLAANNAQAWNGDFAFTGSQDLNLGTGTVTLGGNRQVTVGGATLTVPGPIVDGGAGYSVALDGAGVLSLSGTNTYKGKTVVNGGSLNLSGNQLAANGGLAVGTNSTGGSATIVTGARVFVTATNSLGETNAIQVGNTIASGASLINLAVGGSVTNNGSFLAARGSRVSLNTNSVWVQNGDMQVLGVGGVFGIVSVNAGASFAYTGANPIQLNGAEGNSGQAQLNVAGQFTTPVGFVQTTSPLGGFGVARLTNGGVLKLSAPVADLTGTGVRLVMDLGGGVIDTSGNNAGVSADISGAGSLAKAGAGTLTLSGFANAYTGDTLVNAGTLALGPGAVLPATSTNIVVAGGATLDVAASLLTLAGQTLSNSSSTADIIGNVDASTGALGLTYAASTPSFRVSNGALTLAGTTPVLVNNTGSALGNGTYKLISAGTGGSVAGTVPATVTVGGAGMGAGGTALLSLTGNELFLTVSGASSVNTNATNVTFNVSGTNLVLGWPASHTGWKLQVQTNSRALGLKTNWFDVAGSASTNQILFPINKSDETIFFRMKYP